MIQFPFSRNNSFSVIKRSFLLLLLFSRVTSTQAQETKNYRGVVLSSDTTLVLRGIHVLNLGTKTTTVSDDNGYFSIRYRTGDSIEFRHPDWETKLMTSSELNDSVFLKKNVVLEEVVITANRPNTRFSELQQLEGAE